MIFYLLTFYLFDDIEKNIGITHVNHSATPKAILTKVHDFKKVIKSTFFKPWPAGNQTSKSLIFL